MAGNTVTLTFAGETADLERATSRVGASTDRMGQSLDANNRRLGESRDRLDRTREGFDTLDTRAMGFRDTITGLQDGWRAWNDETLSTPERLLFVGFAIGDLASGMANWLIPALGRIPAVARAAWAAMTGPVGIAVLAIGALVAGVVWAYHNVEWFRNGVNAAWNWIKNAFSAGVSAAWGFLVSLVGRVRSIPGQIIGIFSGAATWLSNAGRAIMEGLWNGIRGAYDWVKRNVSGLLTGIRNLFPFSPAKEGPFSGSGYTDVSGAALMTDFGKGMGSVDLRGVASGALGRVQSGLSASVPGGAAGGGVSGPLQLSVAPGSDGALASLLMAMVRKGELQLVRA